jgi:phospholipid-binding lipoprotein MlaA
MARSRFGTRSAGLLFAVLALALGGCGSLSGNLATLRTTFIDSPPAPYQYTASPALRAGAAVDRETPPELPAAAVSAETRASAVPAPAVAAPSLTTPGFVPVALEPLPDASLLVALADPPEAKPEPVVAQRSASTEPKGDAEVAEYDPWERYNEKMFTFNYKFDKYVLKPTAKGYNFVMPDLFQQMIGHAFDNIVVVPKLANNLLQRNWKGFAVELGRFVINSTLGIGGLFDIAGQEFGLERTKVDFGQTLGKWGVGPGPYLILPFLPPFTVRDGVGYGVDVAMDPLSYVLPFIWDRLGMKLGEIVNDRSLNLDLFQGFEESTVDMYSAVRNGYLQRRYNLIHGTP